MSNSQQTASTFAYPVSSPYTPVSSDSSQPQQNGQITAAAGSTTATTSTQAAPTQSRQAAEEARKDRTLADFMLMLDEYEPLVSLGWCHPYRLIFICVLDSQRSN